MDTLDENHAKPQAENGDRLLTSPPAQSLAVELEVHRPGSYRVIRRNGKVTPFQGEKITLALTKAFLGVEGAAAASSERIHRKVEQLSGQVLQNLTRRAPGGGTLHIEDIQDQVELVLMRSEEYLVARAYVIYREDHARERSRRAQQQQQESGAPPVIEILDAEGHSHPLDRARIEALVQDACRDLTEVEPERVIDDALRNLYSGARESDLMNALIMSARALNEQEPNYSYVAAGLLLQQLCREALSRIERKPLAPGPKQMQERYAEYFQNYIQEGVRLELLDPQLKHYDLKRLGDALEPSRDRQLSYLGLQTLYDRYLIHDRGVRLELPQAFFMRVAMGLSIQEPEREERAIEFYRLLSSFDFMSSTPTLFNSGTRRPQLSSCFLTTVPDHLDGIYSSIRDDALLSKYAGGLGNDWSNVRAMGAHIRGTNGKSQGVVPFLKVVNDTAIAVNQGGKRKGAICAYLEIWHLDIEEFLELRKNTGDDRRRTHDMNTACWIPDLFMQRVEENGHWTLFSPNKVPGLHDCYGEDFRQLYLACEEKAKLGEIENTRSVSAVTLWRRLLSMLYETGHPWITFKDPCNLRSPQQHAGVVHSSNLCTEITLNTSSEEIAVCNLGSVNLAQHVNAEELDLPKLQNTVRTAIRMLDNTIDHNFYTVPQARRSNLRHRPVGLGLMGFQDALYKLRLPYASEQAMEFADRSMEAISYYAIQASNALAQERGNYSSFQGSLWSQGILPIDSIELLEAARKEKIQLNRDAQLDWEPLRRQVQTTGLRNSNCMAIAPTATISNICGVTQSIEPTYQHLFVKSNLSGEFTIVNPYLVADLKAAGLWDEVMVNDLKYFDGSLQSIDRIPAKLKKLYETAFEITPDWLVTAAARRQKWIDQAQSLNLYMAEPDGARLDKLYRLSWKCGLKTTYYLRSLGATHPEKSTMQKGAYGNHLNAVQPDRDASCSTVNGECEACQ